MTTAEQMAASALDELAMEWSRTSPERLRCEMHVLDLMLQANRLVARNGRFAAALESGSEVFLDLYRKVFLREITTSIGSPSAHHN